METSIALSFSQVVTGDSWVNLEQLLDQPHRSSLSGEDLLAMIHAVQSGVSARFVGNRNCPIIVGENNIYVRLPFYAWPSSMTLNYNMTSDLATFTDREVVEVPRSFDITIPMQREVSLPFLVRGELEWQTPAYNRLGQVVKYPSVRISGSKLICSDIVFGVVRFRGVARGHKYFALFTFDKTAQGVLDLQEWESQGYDTTRTDEEVMYSRFFETGGLNTSVATEKKETVLNTISGVNSEIEATWMDNGEEEKNTLKMVLPECVTDALKVCDESEEVLIGGEARYTIHPPTEVYYSTCSGDVKLVYQPAAVSPFAGTDKNE